MANQADEQRQMVRSILKTAMEILRDDKPFDPSDSIFGRIIDTDRHYRSKGLRYLYASRVSTATTISFSTFDNPEDYTADRSKMKIVPTAFVMRLSPMLVGLPSTEIKALLQLEGYWVDSDGNREYGNEIMVRTPDMPNLQSFRYRSKDIPGGKFTIDVELLYANPLDGSFPPKLSEITILRAYKILTPEEREQRRLEQQQAKRLKYGKMNLCTGMICPETGIWEGWSDNGPTDQLLVHAGREFPEVRTIHFHVQWYCPHAPGRWMWLKDDSERGLGSVA
ncbi:hypothetical protein [Burkholderia sp. D-99]|uniref:hypothetical protein n=1 Tax=Burkholderia sp. D-99 TaxID=2717316 RepID=UPI00141FB65A|nr:hypothetical protein [Burkholderia sp. D-99]NHV26353.1 hypothetical protein [Burkholderia sp. D-99]